MEKITFIRLMSCVQNNGNLKIIRSDKVEDVLTAQEMDWRNTDLCGFENSRLNDVIFEIKMKDETDNLVCWGNVNTFISCINGNGDTVPSTRAEYLKIVKDV